MTPRGLASSNATAGGIYSKYMPAGPMADAYARMHADRQSLHSLAEKIKVMESFWEDDLSQLAGAEIATITAMIGNIADGLTREKEPISAEEGAAQLRQLAATAQDARAARRRAIAVAHDQAKLVDTDLRRQAQQEHMVTTEQAISFAYAVGDGMKELLGRLGAQQSDYAELRDQIQRAAARWLMGANPDDVKTQ